jgi:hypothetical protein
MMAATGRKESGVGTDGGRLFTMESEDSRARSLWTTITTRRGRGRFENCGLPLTQEE